MDVKIYFVIFAVLWRFSCGLGDIKTLNTYGEQCGYEVSGAEYGRNGDCAVGPWTGWTDCGHETNGVAGDYDFRHVTGEEKAQGTGASTMAGIRTMKLNEWNEIENRRNDGCSPQFKARTSRGVTQCRNGFAGGFPCKNIDLLAMLTFTELGFNATGPQSPFGGVWATDMWGWHDKEKDDYYAIVGLSQGTSFVRITNPGHPQVIGILRTAGDGIVIPWRDMKTVKNHVFIVSEIFGHGMQVFDLTRLRNLTPTHPVREFTADAHYDLIGQSHNIAANEMLERVYILGADPARFPQDNRTRYITCQGGLHIVDVSNPKAPKFVKCMGEDGFVHDAECLVYDGPDTRYQGKEICFGFNEDTVTIYDVTNGTIISRVTYTGVTYAHQGWATEDLKWLLSDDEADEFVRAHNDSNTRTFVWNIVDLQNPVLTNTYRSAQTAIDHNLYLKGNIVYQSNYQAGLRVLRFNNGTGDLSEIAYFDVFPSSTAANFSGSWSNYPFLPDNVVAMTSMQFGLFLVKLDESKLQLRDRSLSRGSSKCVTLGERHRYREAVWGTDGDDCPALMESEKCT